MRGKVGKETPKKEMIVMTLHNELSDVPGLCYMWFSVKIKSPLYSYQSIYDFFGDNFIFQVQWL